MEKKSIPLFTERKRIVRSVPLLILMLCLSLCTCAMADSFDDDGMLRLVNREEKITKHYAPDDLVLPDVPTNKKGQKNSIYMRPEAAEALEELFAGALEDEYTLLAVSGYRSYSTQYALFQQKVESVGSKEAAQRTVAPPGASEHQLGLAMDLVSDTFRNLNRAFLETDEGKWVNDHCWEYGFIIRYRAEWSGVTGYKAEPWHIRYLGREHAQAVTELNIPYEEYAAQMRLLPEYVLTYGTAALFEGLYADLISGEYEMIEVLENSVFDAGSENNALQSVTVYYEERNTVTEDALTP